MNRKDKRNVCLISLIFCIIFIAVASYFLIQNPIQKFPKYPEEYPPDAIDYDDSFNQIYCQKIKPHGAEKINSICCSIKELNYSEEQLNSIANWVIDDFLYGNNENVKCGDRLCRYWIYENGNIRAYTSEEQKFLFWEFHWNSPYRDDPYWIAYYKVGACEELAVLFEEVASRMGFTTRRVGYPNIHQWVEIKLNDVWWYFDPTCYYHNYRNENSSFKWFNQTSNYRNNCLNVTSPVIVAETGEDISEFY